VLVLSASGEVTLTNPAWDQLLGDSYALVPERENGKPLSDSEWSLRRVLEDEPFTLEFTLDGGDGNRRWFEARTQAIPHDGERGGMVVVREITDRSLRHLQERFLAVASHELRTPMTSLSGSLQLMSRRLERTDGDDVLRKHLDRASDQFHRLELLIGELTDIVRLRGGRFALSLAPADLRAMASEAVELASDTSRDIEVRLEVPDTEVVVAADRMRLEQVLLNLILNAFRHATVTERVDVRVRRDTRTASVEVQDYGPGIAEEDLANIFTEFHRARRQDGRADGGLGLGLFIAREIVAAHNGTIDARSIPGKGVTFVVKIPLQPDDPDAQPSGDTA
jgi:two-component system CheB/CheR fusion protein